MTDVTQNFDCVFWFGDLNFRLAQAREDVIHWVEEYKFPLLVDLKADQLKKLIIEGTYVVDEISNIFLLSDSYLINCFFFLLKELVCQPLKKVL